MATPNYLQTKGYTAKMDRQLISSTIIQEGVAQPMAGELAVSAGSGLQVSVAAGSCFVQGDTNPGQGMYHVNFPSTTTISVTANSSGNPRVDLVCCQISDTTEAGGSNDSADLVVVAGTPASGATLSNLSGAASPPASSLPLAYLLVPNGAASFTAASFLDRRTTYGSSRGKSIIAATESRTNTSYATLTTPDIVRNIVLPTDGLIKVAFQGTWQNSVSTAGRAAIFVGSNQLKLSTNGTPNPVAQEANGGNVTNSDGSLVTAAWGLMSSNQSSYSGDVTTGQVIGVNDTLPAAGPVYLFAAAGTYDISIQYKSTSGSITAKNRKLWVWTEPFR